MKTIKFLLLLFVFGMLTSCDIETPDKAATYNDKIITQTDNIMTIYDDFIDLYIEAGDVSELRKPLDNVRDEATKSLKSFKELGDFYEDKTFVNAAIVYVESISENCDFFDTLLDLEEEDNYDDDQYDELLDKINDNNDDSYDGLVTAQEAFAIAHEYDLY